MTNTTIKERLTQIANTKHVHFNLSKSCILLTPSLEIHDIKGFSNAEDFAWDALTVNRYRSVRWGDKSKALYNMTLSDAYEYVIYHAENRFGLTEDEVLEFMDSVRHIKEFIDELEKVNKVMSDLYLTLEDITGTGGAYDIISSVINTKSDAEVERAVKKLMDAATLKLEEAKKTLELLK